MNVFDAVKESNIFSGRRLLRVMPDGRELYVVMSHNGKPNGMDTYLCLGDGSFWREVDDTEDLGYTRLDWEPVIMGEPVDLGDGSRT